MNSYHIESATWKDTFPLKKGEIITEDCRRFTSLLTITGKKVKCLIQSSVPVTNDMVGTVYMGPRRKKNKVVTIRSRIKRIRPQKISLRTLWNREIKKLKKSKNGTPNI